MKKIIWLVLILAIQAAVVMRIDDKYNSRLTPNDTILSTMGLYRMVLEPKNCSLRMEKFDSKLLKYSPYMNCYSVSYPGGSCNYLEVQNGRIVTDSGAIYADLKSSSFAETAMIIDNTGVVQL